MDSKQWKKLLHENTLVETDDRKTGKTKVGGYDINWTLAIEQEAKWHIKVGNIK